MEEESGKDNKKRGTPAAGWEIIYTSLALILVALFAMLVSYSTVEKEKISLFRGYEVIEEGNEPVNGAGRLLLSPDVAEGLDGAVVRAMKSLGRYLRKAGLGESVRIEIIEKGFKATFENNVLFPSGVAAINKEAYPSLDEMIKIARKEPFSIRVEGHTDSVPIDTPAFPSNWELSTTRAVNILRYLLEKGELPADRLAAVGFSQYHPVASNDVSEGRQKNRRVEFYFELSS